MIIQLIVYLEELVIVIVKLTCWPTDAVAGLAVLLIVSQELYKLTVSLSKHQPIPGEHEPVFSINAKFVTAPPVPNIHMPAMPSFSCDQGSKLIPDQVSVLVPVSYIATPSLMITY
jgi:hypothetical protein